MTYLVDTHIFLWSLFASKHLSARVSNVLRDPQHTKMVSAITFWEISLKYQLGKLELINILPDALPAIAKEAGFEILDLDAYSVSSFYQLPKLKNKDPFDRMLAWQAIQKKFLLITKDADFSAYAPYGLHIVW